MLSEDIYDLLIIGGGINGAGIAADAAGRGLSVLLVDKGDLGGATSSASSKLIHGGLRYLEQFEFRLVREALKEREVLLARAPHIIYPLRFILPHSGKVRNKFVIRAGLFLYDHLAKRRQIPHSRFINFKKEHVADFLRKDLDEGYVYWDCWGDDSRLVILNARLAQNKGALILPRTRVTNITQGANFWTVSLDFPAHETICRARVVVNAAGPWASQVQNLISSPYSSSEDQMKTRLKLVKGSHLVVPRISNVSGEDAFILQNKDGRVIFILPFEKKFNLIGTTDVNFEGDPSTVRCSPDEEKYLLEAVNIYLQTPLKKEDILWRFSGVRSLKDDPVEEKLSSLSRDYYLELRGRGHGSAFLTIIGGKVTTYRRLAEEVLEKLRPEFPSMGKNWTETTPLPGGNIPESNFNVFFSNFQKRYAWLPLSVAVGLARRHGGIVDEILKDARNISDLGVNLGYGLYEREVIYFVEREWARSHDDILWRRTKVGLHLIDPRERNEMSKKIEEMISM